MLGQFMRFIYERVIYKIPKNNQQAWFTTSYSPEQKELILGLLKSQFESCPTTTAQTEIKFIEVIAEVVFDLSIAYQHINSVSINENSWQLNASMKRDFLTLCIIVALCNSEQLETRIQSVLVLRRFIKAEKSVWSVLDALCSHDVTKLKKQSILGEGYHNKISRLNGMANYGWFEYRRQMKSMQKKHLFPKYQARYAFINQLPSHTLGGSFRQLMRDADLSIVGEPSGFPAFFIWHDLIHLLSGNGTNFPGELGANAFTAGFSKKCKLKILLWGLIQFNLGYSLAVVATPAKNQFKNREIMHQYLSSLMSGCSVTMDLLNWTEQLLIEDLKLDIDVVREKYHIKRLRAIV